MQTIRIYMHLCLCDTALAEAGYYSGCLLNLGINVLSNDFLFKAFAISKRGGVLLLLPLIALPVNAADLSQIDRLTEQWLNTERQASSLQSDWRAQQPLLEQRLALLQAEKEQLQAMMAESRDSQSDVTTRRAALLQNQAQLEQGQIHLERGLQSLALRLDALMAQVPPPLKNTLRQERYPLNQTPTQVNETPNTSVQLQAALAKLSRLGDFNQRITVHQSPLVRPDGSAVLVKQLYLGLGMAWFVSNDGQYAGWGQVREGHWYWRFDDRAVNASSVLRAIAVFEKQQQAQWVRLPIHLVTSSPLEEPLHTQLSEGAQP